MIKIKNLKKSFDDKEILKGINLEINKGETIAIIGPSGSGKSTLLRCLNLLEYPDSGEIIINDIDITKDNIDENYVRQKIGMVFQQFNLFPHMTVLENITIGPIKVLKEDKNKAKEKAIDLLNLMGLIDKKDEYPSNLSGGQKQRVAIARTLAMNTEVILFDEATSALDPEMVKDVLDVIESLSKKGMTLILVTHEMAFAKNVADKIIFMDDGIIEDMGEPEYIFEKTNNPRVREFLSKVL